MVKKNQNETLTPGITHGISAEPHDIPDGLLSCLIRVVFQTQTVQTFKMYAIQ